MSMQPRPPVTRSSPIGVPTALVGALAMLVMALPISLRAADSDQADPSNKAIAALVRQLDDESFQRRDQASRELASVAASPLGPRVVAALKEAAVGESLEQTMRAVETLRRIAVEGVDEASHTAHQAITELSSSPHRYAKQFAQDTTEQIAAARRAHAVKRFRELGAYVSSTSITLTDRFRGKDADLAMLRYFDVTILHIRTNPNLTDACLKHLEPLSGLVQVTIDRCEKFTEKAVTAFRKKRPKVGVMLYFGGFLGIAGQDHAKGCIVTNVIEGSAAAKAGFKVGDIVTELSNRKIPNLETLVKSLALMRQGQTVRVKFLRDGKPMEISTKLGERP